MHPDFDIAILAAGNSSRFGGDASKIFAPFWGARVIDCIIRKAETISDNLNIILNENALFGNPHSSIIQKTQDGTGGAIKELLKQKPDIENLIVLPGDAPLIRQESLEKIKNAEADLTICVMKMPQCEEKYGRIIIQNGNIVKIEEAIFHPSKTEYANAGFMALRKKALNLIEKLEKKSVKQEFFLTDIVELAHKNGLKIKMIEINQDEGLGINTRQEWVKALSIAQKIWRDDLIDQGVFLMAPETVYLSYDTHIESGAIIEPYCTFQPGVHVRKGAHIKSFCNLEGCQINGEIGPFANIRNGTLINGGAEIGSFVEIKKSIIGKGTKIKHLSYIGDAEVGENCNFGAGSVICNYDGKKKNQSKIGDRVFVGGNASIIAPIKIGDDVVLAAGSAFNEDIDSKVLAIARSRQIIKRKKD